MKFMSLLIFSFFLNQFVFAESQPANTPERGKTKALMHFFYGEISQLRPYLVSEEKFADPKAQALIKKSLENLVQKTDSLHPPAEIEASPGFKTTFYLIADHFKKTQEVFLAGELEYARVRLNGTTNLCVQCHTQVPDKKSNFGFGATATELSEVNYPNAEFLFITRRFDSSLNQFDQLARNYPKSGLKSDELNDLYRKKLAIFARVKRDPTLAINNLTEDLKNSNLPADVVANLKSWIETFNKFKSEGVQLNKMNDRELMAYANKNLSLEPSRKIAPANPEAVKLLYLSGLFYERLMKDPHGKNSGEWLYYLGLCEKSLSNLYWYSLADIYWKECIVTNAKTPIAQRCYKAYDESMRAKFTGEPSPSVKQSLEVLKKYLR